jgi:hypothetical protein
MMSAVFIYAKAGFKGKINTLGRYGDREMSKISAQQFESDFC